MPKANSSKIAHLLSDAPTKILNSPAKPKPWTKPKNKVEKNKTPNLLF